MRWPWRWGAPQTWWSVPATPAWRRSVSACAAGPPAAVGADLYVIGPEEPLVGGLADELRGAGRLVFGPGADGARLEGSKAWMKQLLAEAGVPTAAYGVFEDAPSRHRVPPVAARAVGGQDRRPGRRQRRAGHRRPRSRHRRRQRQALRHGVRPGRAPGGHRRGPGGSGAVGDGGVRRRSGRVPGAGSGLQAGRRG